MSSSKLQLLVGRVCATSTERPKAEELPAIPFKEDGWKTVTVAVLCATSSCRTLGRLEVFVAHLTSGFCLV
eukprot:291278-Amphidinium_carterae.2